MFPVIFNHHRRKSTPPAPLMAPIERAEEVEAPELVHVNQLTRFIDWLRYLDDLYEAWLIAQLERLYQATIKVKERIK